MLHLMYNCQNALYREMSNLKSLGFAFLDRSPMTHFITKVTPIIIIDSVSVEALNKFTEND